MEDKKNFYTKNANMHYNICMKKLLFTIGIFTLLLHFSLSALDSFFDNYVYQSWNAFGTLNGTSATDIIQTSDGYINIGTYEGLARFDGLTFTTHKRSSDNDLTFVSVRAILEDSQGNLWIGSNDEGLQKISADGTKTYTTKNGLPNNSIRCLAEDHRGNVWVGTAAGVVYITPKGHLITAQFEAGTIAKGIIAVSLYCDSAGRMWLLTANERGLFLYNEEIFRTRHEIDQFGNFFATAICQDLKGEFWIALGDDGLVRMRNGTSVEKLKTNTILDNVATTSIYSAPNGDMWFGTEKGLVVYSDNRFMEYSGEILNNAKINKIILDRENNIWFSTDRNGIGKLTKGKFKIKKLGVAVNSVSEERTGKVWIGTDTGVRCYENDVEVTNKLTEYTKDLRVRDVQTTKSGGVLVSCYTKPGLLYYDGNTIKSWTTDEGLAGNKVRVAIETEPGEFYVGTTTGLSIVHADGTIRNFKQNNGLNNEYIMAIYQDTNDIVWIGTDGDGVYLMREEAIISHITSDHGLAGNVIFKITQDIDGAYWICSGSGITRCPNFDSRLAVPDRYENINSENGIGTDSVFQVLADAQNTLWMTSNHGISSINYYDFLDLAKNKGTSQAVKFYTKNDGLDSNGPTSTAKSMIDRYGRIWFTMVDGIAIYDPGKVQENPIMPLVQIETITVDNVVVLDNTLYTSKTSDILLKPGTKRVVITFTGLSFDAPERISFTYKLTNFEDEFCMPTSTRSMSYTNLKPGKHVFYLNSINGDGLYSKQAETVLLVQKPYLYQMTSFWVILVFVIIGTIILLFYHNQRRMMRENIRLEKIVQERTAEVIQEKAKSDELLRAILPNEIADELKDGIHSIGRDYDDVTILFSDIVEFTKTSSGHSASEIVDALNELFTLFDERAQRMGVEKIKTIGDAYMAACGLPSINEEHTLIMVHFAKGMLEDLAEYNKTAKIKFNIRIGLNNGPATAGVIGKTKFIYDVWGNTVNVASRMETAADPGGIRVSASVYEQLKNTEVKFSEPIECNVKGKGMMTTYNVLEVK